MAALFLFTWSVPVPNVGAVALVVGAFVPVLAPTKLPSTLDNVVGALVPFGPLTVVLTGPVTAFPFPSGLVLKIWLPSLSVSPVGYTRLPSLSVYTTGVTALFEDVWSSTFTVIVRTSPSVLPDTMALPVPTNRTSFAFFTVLEYSVSVTAPSAPVVLLEDTIQPMLRISPTVAAVLSLTLGSPPVGLDKSTKPVFLLVVPATLPPYVSNPDFTLVTFTGSVPLGPDTFKSPSFVLDNLGP